MSPELIVILCFVSFLAGCGFWHLKTAPQLSRLRLLLLLEGLKSKLLEELNKEEKEKMGERDNEQKANN